MSFGLNDITGALSGLPNIRVWGSNGRLKVIGGVTPPPTPVVWGSITGLVTNQTDLINYLGLNFYPLSSNPAGYITQAAADLLYYPLTSNPAGYITSAALTGYVPNTRTLTINGTTYDLSADRSWTIAAGGTVTSIGLTVPSAFSVTPSTITTSGTFVITGAGTVSQYIDGTGALRAFPTIPAQYNPTAGTGISITGSYPNQTITNTLPDQTVVLTGGTGISTSGTYPNFTITNTSPSLGGTVTSVQLSAGTGISLSGTNPITTSGTITVTNSAPDQTVVLTAGTGIGISGTYPSFTIDNTGLVSVPDLQQVTDVGATTTNTITIDAGGGTSTAIADYQIDITDSTNRVRLGTDYVAIRSNGSWDAFFASTNLTAGSITLEVPDKTGTYTIATTDQLGLQNAITIDPVLTTNNTIDGGNFSLEFSNVYKFEVGAEQRARFQVNNGTDSANMYASPIDAATYLDYIKGGTQQTFISLRGDELRVGTPDVLTKSVGDVLTLINPASGEVEFQTPGGGGGGGAAGRNYYLNGGTVQGTFGGITDMREMSPVPVVGTNVDFTINADGYIKSFITDAGDPNQTVIPAGNWNFELWFSASSGGGSPQFWVEVSKWNGSAFTLIATSSGAPEGITNGTTIDLYFTALAVPQTTLTSSDRLAVRVYVIHSGRTITLHTQDSHLCQIITTFPSGLVSLNGLTGSVQTLSTGTTGTDFGITSSGIDHTFNLPVASATNTGKLSSGDWTTFNGKVSPTRTLTINGTALDLSADRSWSVGTVTSVSGAGTAFGLTLTGTVTGSGNITLGGTLAVPIANITATGTPSATTFLRGDGSWATPAGGGGGTATIGATIDGSGGTITVGQKGYVQIPYACTIDSWRLIANASGSIVIDIYKAAAPTIPTVSITGSALPTLSSQQTAASSTLTGWTTSVAANDIIGFNVNSATTVSWVILQLLVTKI